MKIIYTMMASVMLLGGSAYANEGNTPIATDSRIKTFVYSENDVYNLVMRYGYQTNIEFSKKEVIETISVGERVAWQISTMGNRIFIRPMQENAHTNMTVITNKRAYQFDLVSASTVSKEGEEIAYVVRFYYADEKKNAPAPSSPVVSSAPVMGGMGAAGDGYNYDYTYSGPEDKAPVKIFDDGKSTYFKFATSRRPAFFIKTPAGLQEVQYTEQDGYTVVGSVAGNFVLRDGSSTVEVYNERSSTN